MDNDCLAGGSGELFIAKGLCVVNEGETGTDGRLSSSCIAMRSPRMGLPAFHLLSSPFRLSRTSVHSMSTSVIGGIRHDR